MGRQPIALSLTMRGWSASARWFHCILILGLLCSLTSIAKAEQKEVFDFNIPRQGIESALNELAGSTSKLLLFPYETVQLEESNPVVGRCTLTDALSVMLQGTGLRGDLTESGVITISQNINEVDGKKVNNNHSSRLGENLRYREDRRCCFRRGYCHWYQSKLIKSS